MSNKILFDFKGRYLYFSILISYTCITFLMNSQVLTHDSYIGIIEQQVDSDVAEKIVSNLLLIQGIGYFVSPIMISLKLFLIAGAIYVCIVLSNLTLSFKEVFKVVLLAELIIFLGDVTKFIYFIYNGVVDFSQLKYFYPLGISNLIKPDFLPNYLQYSFRFINLFEIFYCFTLSYLINLKLNIGFYKSNKLIIYSYAPLLITWNVVIVFIQLQFL